MTRLLMKKGGSARFLIEDFTNMDSFTVPAGYQIVKASVKKRGTTAGNIKLGNYVAPVKEVFNIVVTGDPTANGNISVVIRGADPVLVPIVIADTIATTVTKLATAVYPGWTVAETLGTTVTWTAVTAGLNTGVISITGPAGFAKTGPTEVTGGANATTGEQTVASVALSGTDGNVSDLTLVKSLYEADTKVWVGVSSAATGTLAIQLQKLF
jgi:hypothetical protein